MEAQLLRDQQIYPDESVLKSALDKSFDAWEKLETILSSEEYKFDFQWHYYNDGKAWLCKVVYKKKTVFWLSVWDKFFKTSFFFTEKNASGVHLLEIDEQIKEYFNNSRPIGKLIPLVVNVESKEQINDLLIILGYKLKA
ncbi:hypothetical protein SDC9_205402 [bioreactor metagenome]|uniref:DUF3788 family protein n=1 Tax=bioreactor metagenome TaxID=1076179 RepID=A0A645J208_9ZZZZ|nr:DUF3788 family protein [Paludibacter sp.]